MNREIKFRGNRVDEGGWVFGCLDSNPLMQGRTLVTSYDANRSYVYEVLSETVGQFTGLSDCNGVEIYEGDVISYPEYYVGDSKIKTGVEAVEYDAPGFNDILNLGYGGYPDWVKVIGNIHEDPELLEAKCKYRSICSHYQADAVTCNKEPCGYCGIFREFENKGITDD